MLYITYTQTQNIRQVIGSKVFRIFNETASEETMMGKVNSLLTLFLPKIENSECWMIMKKKSFIEKNETS